MSQIKFQAKSGISYTKINSALNFWSKSENSKLKRIFLKSRMAPHWHISKNGTIEVTFLKNEKILLVIVRENRKGGWAGKSYRKLAEFLQNKLNLQNFKENQPNRYL